MRAISAANIDSFVETISGRLEAHFDFAICAKKSTYKAVTAFQVEGIKGNLHLWVVVALEMQLPAKIVATGNLTTECEEEEIFWQANFIIQITGEREPLDDCTPECKAELNS